MESNVLVSDKYGRVVNPFAEERAVRALAQSILQSRLSFGRHGTAFGGDRDYYQILGYPDELTLEDYRGKFERDGLAARIVEFPADETWRDKPEIKDGEDKDAKDDTEFVKAWRDLAGRLRAYHYCRRVDTLAGLGRYGCLLIGAAGTDDMTLPVQRLSGPNDVLYLRPYSEEVAKIKEFDTDPFSARFGLPLLYAIKVLDLTTNDSNKVLSASHEMDVHWSRVIHVADGLLENEIFGRPRLQRVYNLLDDLLKVIGGSAEATWLLMRKGFVVDIDPEVKLTDADQAAIEEQFVEYVHGIRRMIQGRGLSVSDLGSEVVDPAAIFQAIVSLISAATGIPQRILLGSERGELASSQDASNWAGVIASRQLNFAEPIILRPLIDRFMQWGVLPAPTSDVYTVDWVPLFEMDDITKAQRMQTTADALQKAAAAFGQSPVTVEEFRGEFTPFAEEMPETALPPAAPTPMPQTPEVNRLVAVASAHGYNPAESRAIVVAAARVLSRSRMAA